MDSFRLGIPTPAPLAEPVNLRTDRQEETPIPPPDRATLALRSQLEAQRRQMSQISQVLQSYLPSNFPVLGGLDIVGYCRPCADVAGDFYDVMALPDGRVSICMADVAGHGAQAAIAMATTRALLHAALSDAVPATGPGDILYRLSNWLYARCVEDRYVTMWLGLWDPQTEELRYASAGHPPAVLWSPGSTIPRYLSCETSIPVGLAGIEPRRPRESVVELGLGDRIFLYTDGWTETSSHAGNFLAGAEFLSFLGNAYGQPLRQTPIFLFTEFERHSANSTIRDDVSLLVFDRIT